MVCPKCGHVLERRWSDQLGRFAGLGVSFFTAVLGQAELLPDGRWRHGITIAGICGVGLFGTIIQLYVRQPVPAVTEGTVTRETGK